MAPTTDLAQSRPVQQLLDDDRERIAVLLDEGREDLAAELIRQYRDGAGEHLPLPDLAACF